MVNERDEILLLSEEPGSWSIVAGAVDAGEMVLESARRELREEAGDTVQATPIGVVRAHPYHYDSVAQNMISIYYAMRHESGEVVSGDDMAGAQFEWWSPDQVRERIDEIAVPHRQFRLFEPALAYARFDGQDEVDLEYSVNQKQ